MNVDYWVDVTENELTALRSMDRDQLDEFMLNADALSFDVDSEEVQRVSAVHCVYMNHKGRPGEYILEPEESE